MSVFQKTSIKTSVTIKSEYLNKKRGIKLLLLSDGMQQLHSPQI